MLREKREAPGKIRPALHERWERARDFHERSRAPCAKRQRFVESLERAAWDGASRDELHGGAHASIPRHTPLPCCQLVPDATGFRDLSGRRAVRLLRPYRHRFVTSLRWIRALRIRVLGARVSAQGAGSRAPLQHPVCSRPFAATRGAGGVTFQPGR